MNDSQWHRHAVDWAGAARSIGATRIRAHWLLMFALTLLVLVACGQGSASIARIAFLSERDGNREIYVMDADGSNQTRLTHNPAFDESPDWSSDGTKIAFLSERDGNGEIYVMDADGSNQTRLTHNPAFDAYPTWSPDGTKIAFDSARDGNQEIYVIDADGGGLKRLTKNPFRDSVPTWSPEAE